MLLYALNIFIAATIADLIMVWRFKQCKNYLIVSQIFIFIIVFVVVKKHAFLINLFACVQYYSAISCLQNNLEVRYKVLKNAYHMLFFY
jgi:hypothetical protein